MQHLIVFFSPAGTTRRVARHIEHCLADRGVTARVLDLGVPADGPVPASQIGLESPCCLWVGSPVYCDHALPLVAEWIEGLSVSAGGWAVPFVTWGGVTSGLALPELADLLQARGFQPVGAAKVLAEHSSMWAAAKPLGAGRPDAADLEQVSGLVAAVVANLEQADATPLDLQQLDYLSPSLRNEAATKSLAKVKAMMPAPKAVETRCTQCGECAAACPVGAITLNPYPVMAENCVRCQQCVQICPEGAFPHDAATTAARITARAAAIDEEKVTRMFC
ncbi:MAG: EFR1 family ferrodoxin [Desulfobulbus sp.]|jgi:ferredoxin|nr:EFR1 family ferrodoxin [Desulfobulbus sp.]